MPSSPQRLRLALAAVVVSLATFGAFKAYQAISRRRKRQALDLDVARSIAKSEGFHPNVTRNARDAESSEHFWASTTQRSEVYDEDLIREQLARNYAFFGEDGMARIRGGHVVVVGCGGVGSYVALMLARSGVSKIRLIDFDYVTLSSLNRHATALLSDVGTPKVKCVERTIKDIAKWVEVDARIEIWRKEEGGAELLEGADWVVGERFCYHESIRAESGEEDAIDNIATKVDLLKYCHGEGIRVLPRLISDEIINDLIQVFASMGAGAKADPTRVQIR